MLRGAKPKPTVVKLVAKTQKPSRSKPEPKFIRKGMPKPPKKLDADALEAWNDVVEDLYDAGILASTDRTILTQYAIAMSNFAKIRRIMDEKAKIGLEGDYGLFEKTSNGNTIQAPVLGASNKAQLLIARLCEQLGMTPSARSRVAPISPDEGEEDPASKYLDD